MYDNTDSYEEAKNLFPKLDWLVREIESTVAEISILGPTIQTEQGSAYSVSNNYKRQGEHLGVRLGRAHEKLSGLKSSLDSMISNLSTYASRLQDLSIRYENDAKKYSEAALISEYLEMGRAEAIAKENANLRRRQAREVANRIALAQGVLKGGPEETSFPPGSGSLNGLVGDALDGLPTRPSHYFVKAASETSYSSTIEPGIYRAFPAYQPGVYTLHARISNEYHRDHPNGGGGMAWYR